MVPSRQHTLRSSVSDVLVSDAHGLVGKPDYILERDGELVPVERKSRKLSAAGAYEGEILQLSAYCLLVEEHFAGPVRIGRLRYQNRSVDVPFDDRLRAKLHDALRALREADRLEEVPRCHSSSGRCRACGFRDSCRESLAQSA
jgi:CRISPR-associated exonuclease Cas4